MFASLMTSRRFAPLFWCQLCSALNDNFLKNALGMLILFGLGGVGATSGEHAGTLITLSGIVFIALVALSALVALPVQARAQSPDSASASPAFSVASGQIFTSKERAATAVPPAKGELLLLVDDEKPILQVAQALLEGHGYRVLTAGEATEALAIFAIREG